jgi:hypothetical protein
MMIQASAHRCMSMLLANPRGSPSPMICLSSRGPPKITLVLEWAAQRVYVWQKPFGRQWFWRLR